MLAKAGHLFPLWVVMELDGPTRHLSNLGSCIFLIVDIMVDPC